MARNIKVLLVLVLLGLVVALPQWTDSYYDRLLVLCVIYAIVAMSFNLYLGFLGGLTLGHAAFFALGGYTSGLLATKEGWSTGMGFLGAIVVCGLGALVLGLPALRLKGAYFVLITVAFHGIIGELAITLNDLTGSTSGLRGIPSPHFFATDFSQPENFYYLAFGFLAIIFIMLWALLNSRVGRGFIAVRDNEVLANSMGINPFKYRMIGFVASAMIGACGGWLWAHHLGIMDPSVFGFDILFNVVFMVILGGTGTLFGPILGAVIVVFGPELFVEHVYAVDEAWRTAFLSLFMLVVILAMPQGVWGYAKGRWMMFKFKRLAKLAEQKG